MTNLQVHISKEILTRTKFCGHEKGKLKTGEHCAVAEAIRDIFPDAYVANRYLLTNTFCIKLPAETTNFINAFDNATPTEREYLKPFSFSISIPDEIINRINIDEVKELLNNHPTLKLV
jgi:hypothetical protein